MPDNSVKEICGVMFEIRQGERSKKIALPTSDIKKAAKILLPKASKRCPHCSSDKCLTNIVGQSLVSSALFRGAGKRISVNIGHLDIAQCRNSSKEFIIARSLRNRSFDSPDKKLCYWCGSPYIEKIRNIDEVRKSFFSQDRLRKYKWWVSRDTSFIQWLEGLSVDDANLFRYADPCRCKHCNRIFGYKYDTKRGMALLKSLGIEIRRNELNEYLQKKGIDKKIIAIRHKRCPLCCEKIDFEKWYREEIEGGENTNGFIIIKYKCGKCSKEFFDIFDFYLEK